MSSQMKVLVVGGVACGPKVASRLKRIKPEADITIIEKGDLLSYGACGLPYFVEGLFSDIGHLVNTPAGVPRNPEFFISVKGVSVRSRCEAIRILRDEKQLEVKNLSDGTTERLEYDKLVLATGGSPFAPPIPGLELENVSFMTHPWDAEDARRKISSEGLNSAVIVGAGFIGMEMAEALTRYGVKVTVVEMMDQVMPGVLDPDIAILGARHLEEKGVALVLGEKVVGLEGDGKVSGVRTDRQLLPADMVIVAVGTRPNMKLAEDAGLSCDAGILVNEFGQTEDPDIYAGGDCAGTRYVRPEYDRPLYVPLGSTANKVGRIIANHIAGMNVPFGGISCTSIVRVFDITLGRTGLGEKQAEALAIDYETCTCAGPDRPHYMPGAGQVIIKMIASKSDRKLLGVQITGMGDASKRLDVAATVIRFGGTLEELTDIDFGYAPPYGPPLDPLAVCAHVLINKLDGIAKCISAAESRKRIEQGNVTILDVRSPEEVFEARLPFNMVHIPLEALRERANELPRDREIITYCKVSMRGYEAQRILNAAGFDNVSFVEGGISCWPYGLDRG